MINLNDRQTIIQLTPLWKGERFPEPPVEDSPLYNLPNVFLTPHIAGSSGSEVQRMSAYMLEEYRRRCKGEPLKWEVTPKLLETMA